MTIRQIIGMVMLAAALLFGVAGLWLTNIASFGGDTLTVRRLWALISESSLDFAQSLVERHVWAPIWDVGISSILVAPAWSFFMVLGLLFFILGRPRPA